MTSRERINRTLARGPVDRVPNGLGGCETAGMHCLAYDRLKKVLGIDDRANRIGTFMTNAVFEPKVLDAMDGDIILLGTKMCPSRLWGSRAADSWRELIMWDTPIQVAKGWNIEKGDDGTWRWGDMVCPPGGYYFDSLPAADSGTLALGADQPSPDDYHPGQELPESLLRTLQEDASFLYEGTGYSIMCGEFIQDLQLRPGGTQNWWMRMATEPEACHEFLGRACDAAISHLEQIQQAVGGYCDMMMIADDIGSKNGVLIGPELWRSIYKPHYARLFEAWHRLTDMKVSLHCCGSVIDILDDLIECGVDVYNPVQISANGMDPVELKDRFGDRIVFYGGVADSILLPSRMTEDEVYSAVKGNLEIFTRDGGYIFAGVHNLPADFPESHIRGMIRAYRDYS